MTYLVCWLICSICTYCLAKNYIESLLKPFGGLTVVFRKTLLDDPETTYEDKWTLENTPDSLIGAINWTILLIACGIIWPVIVSLILYGKLTGYTVTKEDLED